MGKITNNMIAWYPFNDEKDIGKDASGSGLYAEPWGRKKPEVMEVAGRKAARFYGGAYGNSFIKLSDRLMEKVSDSTGITIACFVYLDKGGSVWERIFDFGKDSGGPYLFLTRNMRGICHGGRDLPADPGKSYPEYEWMHVAMTVTGTKRGTMSSAGPKLYINGEPAADGLISQTSSGTYKRLREWFDTFEDKSNYSNNYIGHSQFDADKDFEGAVSDFRIYNCSLAENEILQIMCESLSDYDIVCLARDKFLPSLPGIVTNDLTLQDKLMDGTVLVKWESDSSNILTEKGQIKDIKEAALVNLKAVITKGESRAEKMFSLSVVPKDLPPYDLTIHADKEVLDISETLYGLFYEDINNAADGGIYAELVSNRSFEAFVYDTYDHRSGKEGKSTGRNHMPLMYWYGDTEKAEARFKGGLDDYFGIKDKDVNSCYITVKKGTSLSNRGFSDSTGNYAMRFRKDTKYTFSIWAKAEGVSLHTPVIGVVLKDKNGNIVSNKAEVKIKKDEGWNKYEKIILTVQEDCFGQLVLEFSEDMSIDMVSLMPNDVWGAKKEKLSDTANDNYKNNPNYRLRKDLVESLINMHPKFLRFPGGCISEGSYIWDNVYDWKDSVGEVEIRKENFNVWGYMMTMGLGYMEYFQLAEDLNAVPLPVMACGVLCQARSDYANPAGGKLQKKYIKNFTDLIDFAISMDFEGNKWAALRKKMGHEAAFDLHYLGVGNENWGEEFFANFQIYKREIDKHMKKNYTGYELHIISTVGAQADDGAYKHGWRFLSGNMNGKSKVEFTDGINSFEEEITWYKYQKNYMETIADEHYYRSNEYLLENVDRYNYYYRAYDKKGNIKEKEFSKVFVGEYASTDKNTLAGAVAEAAVMTGFENNSDVVRLAAYAPLFNKVLKDGTYRWTPDAIWFDDESVWHTPNYYVQQMFAKYIGKKLLETSFMTYMDGKKKRLSPRGGISIEARNAEIIVKEVKVISNKDNKLLFEQDFTKEFKPEWKLFEQAAGYIKLPGQGIMLKAQESGRNGLYIIEDDWSDYRVCVKLMKHSGTDGFYVGAGVLNTCKDKESMYLFAVGEGESTTGIKVYKDGKQGYTMGDYSSSTTAGNLRDCHFEAVRKNKEYEVCVDFGGKSGRELICSYYGNEANKTVLSYKLEAYNRDVFYSVTKDEKYMYAKLVNADSFEKKILVNVEGEEIKNKINLITLTAKPELVHTPNVNKKGNEQVVPEYSSAKVSKGQVVLTLPADSVTVAVFERR